MRHDACVTQWCVNMQLTYFRGDLYCQRVKNYYIVLLGFVTHRWHKGVHMHHQPVIYDDTIRRILRSKWKRGVVRVRTTKQKQTFVEVLGKIPHSHRHHQSITVNKLMQTASCTCQSGTRLFSCTPLPLRSCDLVTDIGWLKPWMISSRRSRSIMGNVVYRCSRRCVREKRLFQSCFWASGHFFSFSFLQ